MPAIASMGLVSTTANNERAVSETPRKVSKTALKFLGLTATVNSFNHRLEGTHVDNLKGWFPELEDAGYVTIAWPWVRITPAGSAALAAHAAAGGRVAR